MNTNNGPCKVEGCKNQARTRRSGLCSNHYQRMRRNGDPTVRGWDVDRPRKRHAREKAVTEKRCAMCKKVKPRSEYYVQSRENGEYLYAYCIPCHNAYTRANAAEQRAKKPPKPPRVIPDCAFEGCRNPGATRLAKGEGPLYCNAHYNQVYTGQEMTPLRKFDKSYVSEDLRRCTSCYKVKSVEAFHLKTNRVHRMSECKACNVKAQRFLNLRKQGRLEEALRATESMPEAMREKYLTKYASDFNGANLTVPISGEVNA